jgi:hypothetical protein
LAWTAIATYPVGLILLNAALLFCQRRAITAGSSPDGSLAKAIGFLYREYEPHFYWWEVHSWRQPKFTKGPWLVRSL